MPKPNLVIITEGQTETRALPELLTTHLRGFGWESIFPTIGRPGTVKGGTKSFKALLDNIRLSAQQYNGGYISTFFDYYGLKLWAGYLNVLQQSADNSGLLAQI
ncbi:MAG: DUF4276 family protein [Candidatus Adiutrix sp.]|jgi:hypothetical protein|nr:DUF4276 family protein [Candidatus Adiutrix sp.]